MVASFAEPLQNNGSSWMFNFPTLPTASIHPFTPTRVPVLAQPRCKHIASTRLRPCYSLRAETTINYHVRANAPRHANYLHPRLAFHICYRAPIYLPSTPNLPGTRSWQISLAFRLFFSGAPFGEIGVSNKTSTSLQNFHFIYYRTSR